MFGVFDLGLEPGSGTFVFLLSFMCSVILDATSERRFELELFHMAGLSRRGAEEPQD